MAGNALNSKSPNMQSPPNVSVSKNVDPQMVASLGNLPGGMGGGLANNQQQISMANSMGGGGLQSMNMQQQGNPGQQQQTGGGGMTMNPGGGLVMTSSGGGGVTVPGSNSMSGMAGGSLIVSNSLNKQPLNTVSMMGGNAQGIHHPGPQHAVGQMPNGPAMLNARAMAMQQQQQQQHMVQGPTRGQSPHQQVQQVGIGPGGPRMQAPPNMSNMANMGQMGAGNSYGYGKFLRLLNTEYSLNSIFLINLYHNNTLVDLKS